MLLYPMWRKQECFHWDFPTNTTSPLTTITSLLLSCSPMCRYFHNCTSTCCGREEGCFMEKWLWKRTIESNCVTMVLSVERKRREGKDPKLPLIFLSPSFKTWNKNKQLCLCLWTVLFLQLIYFETYLFILRFTLVFNCSFLQRNIFLFSIGWQVALRIRVVGYCAFCSESSVMTCSHYQEQKKSW